MAFAAAVGIAGYLGLAMAAAGPLGGLGYWLMLAVGVVVLAAGSLLARRAPKRTALLVILIAGAAMRLVLVPLEPALSTDTYRYLWDGRIQAAGINPYVHAPEDEALAGLRDEEVWPNINRTFARTIYPPVAQFAFLAAEVTGIRTPVAWKGVTATVDIASMLLLVSALHAAGRDERWVVAYAWNPLPIMAFGLTGHVDALVVLAVMGATLLWWRGRPAWTGALLGVAAGVKLFPLMLVAAYVRGRDGAWRWKEAATVAGAAVAILGAGYLPYAAAGSDVLGFLSTGYLDEEGYLDRSRYRLLRALGLDGRVVAPLLGVAVGIAVLRSRRPAPTRGAWLLGAALVLTTPYSWYATPLVALAAAGGAGWAWGWFAIALHAAYISIFHDQALEPLIAGVRLSTPLRVASAGAIATLAALAARWEWARRTVLWQPPPRQPVGDREPV